jgi:hypothetical protein
MSKEMILVVPQFVGMVLSFALLFRARRLSVGLWSTETSRRLLPAWTAGEQPSEIDQIFRA